MNAINHRHADEIQPQHLAPTAAGKIVTLTINIDGMTCAACAARIEKILNKLPDTTAAVNFATETAQIKTTTETKVEQIIAAVTRAGYQASPRHKDRQDNRADQAHNFTTPEDLRVVSVIICR